MEPLQWEPRLIQFQHILTKQDYLSRAPLPGCIDAVIFKLLNQNKKFPDKKTYPHFYYWYIIMKQFSIHSIQNWISQQIYIDDHSNKLVQKFSQLITNKNIRTQQRIISLESALSRQNSLKGQQRNQIKKFNQITKNMLFSFQKDQTKKNYLLTIDLKTIQNLQHLSQKVYELKLQIKELRFDRNQKCVFLRFLSDKENCQQVKRKIQQWNEVQKISCKKIKTKPRTRAEQNKIIKITKTTNYRS